MTSSENLASLEPWTFRPSFPDSWISEAFARDTETLTKALQKSLSCESDTLTADTKNSPFYNLVKPEQMTPTSSVSDPDNITSKRRNSVATTTISNGKISKRKSRATKRSPTTFITADPSNFRQMVQQVTGIQFGNNSHVAVAPVLKPEPQRLANRIPNSCLPTLDTSAFLLNLHQQHQEAPPTSADLTACTPPGNFSFAPVTDGAVGLDFDALHSFPTLESWRVM